MPSIRPRISAAITAVLATAWTPPAGRQPAELGSVLSEEAMAEDDAEGQRLLKEWWRLSEMARREADWRELDRILDRVNLLREYCFGRYWAARMAGRPARRYSRPSGFPRGS